ncbi:metal-dependent hydrolase [Halorussus amylolyticus]|uniref:metal-dependent hydrolase n=1 Tax=Halorussus amylolyticus TaxID=1126242 RepID=UPI0010523F97|nr:metal-dependent hydrolase [Halorussus amylolyticus]
MWPWGHLAVGYLSYSILVRVRTRRAPESLPTVALAFGTQFPDLVDKPLAWTLGVLPNGRSLTHSLLVAALVVGAVGLVLRRRNRTAVADAFAVGYLTHIAGDAVFPLLAGEYGELGFLLWPVVPAIEYTTRPSFVGHLRSFSVTAFTGVELLGALAVVGLWVLDGTPGVSVLKTVHNWVVHRLSSQ